jgi:hypothetical protein
MVLKNSEIYLDSIHTIKEFDPEVHLELLKNEKDIKEEIRSGPPKKSMHRYAPNL